VLRALFDSKATTPATVAELRANLAEVIRAIRGVPQFANSWILFCPEAAPPMVPEMLKAILDEGEFHKIVMAHEGNKQNTKVGCIKDGATTALMCYGFKWCLSVGAAKRWSKCIYMTNTAIELVYGNSVSKQTATRLFLDSILRSQLLGLSASADELSKKPTGEQNDLAIACIMNSYWMTRIMNSPLPEYKEMALKHDFRNRDLISLPEGRRGTKRPSEGDEPPSLTNKAIRQH
jgi:hypothetical protein